MIYQGFDIFGIAQIKKAKFDDSGEYKANSRYRFGNLIMVDFVVQLQNYTNYYLNQS